MANFICNLVMLFKTILIIAVPIAILYRIMQMMIPPLINLTKPHKCASKLITQNINNNINKLPFNKKKMKTELLRKIEEG